MSHNEIPGTKLDFNAQPPLRTCAWVQSNARTEGKLTQPQLSLEDDLVDFETMCWITAFLFHFTIFWSQHFHFDLSIFWNRICS